MPCRPGLGAIKEIPAMHALIRGADRALYWFIVLQVAAMTTVVVLQVFNRYVVNYVFGWEEETARYLMVWSSFLAAAYALREGEQLGMEFVIKRLPVVGQRALRTLCHLLVMAFLGVVAYQGLFVMMPQQLDQVSPSLGITMAIPYAAIPISALMLLAVEVLLLWQEWHGRPITPPSAVPLEL
jgi:TRAP-type C4-dicarboxylate transport system permease small subunit